MKHCFGKRLVMTKKIFYEKVGRRYKPVAEYNSDLMDAMHKGTHIVMCYPGGRSTRYGIDPAFGPMIAAGRFAEDAISQKLMDTSALRVAKNVELTEYQRKCWYALQDALGSGNLALEWCSYREAAEAGVKAMQIEAEKMLENPAVRKAWDYFIMTWQLTKERDRNED